MDAAAEPSQPAPGSHDAELYPELDWQPIPRDYQEKVVNVLQPGTEKTTQDKTRQDKTDKTDKTEKTRQDKTGERQASESLGAA